MTTFFEIPPFAPMKHILQTEEMSKTPLPVIIENGLPQFHRDKHLNQVCRLPSMGIYHIKEGYVGPFGLALNQRKQFFHSRDLFGHQYLKDSVENSVSAGHVDNGLYRASKGLSEIVSFDHTVPIVVLNKPGYQVYGHWLIDILPSLWFFILNRERHGIDPNDVMYLLPSATPMWGLEMLKLLFGLSEDSLIFYDDVKELVTARHFILISRLHYNDCILPMATNFFDQIVTSLGSKIDLGLPKRFFISRRGVRSFIAREVGNTAVLEEIAQEKGLTIVDPGQMPWSDQIRMFADAELVVGPFGSGLHNTLFSPSNTVSLSLGASRMNWLQSGISALRKQRMAYLMPSAENVQGDNVILDYDPNTFASALDFMIQHCK